MLAAAYSAIIHDYEHPHVNNHFLIDQADNTAVEFNDQAVAENHSIKQGLMLISAHPELDILAGWRSKSKKAFRKYVIQTVLATDMTRHFEIQSQFKNKVGDN